jgi:hypothetical protein
VLFRSAKALGQALGYPSISFESPMYDGTPVQVMIPADSNSVRTADILNIYSGSSFMSMAEDGNIENDLIDYSAFWLKYATPYDTMCYFAGACAVDSRFDKVCKDTVGWDKYQSFFTNWGRTRLDNPDDTETID